MKKNSHSIFCAMIRASCHCGYAVIVCVLLTTCSSGNGDNSGQNNNKIKPVIRALSITPLQLRFTGGNVNVSAEVQHTVAIQDVRILISDVAGNSLGQTVLTQEAGDVDAHPDTTIYSGAVPLSQNESLGEADVLYQLKLRVRNVEGGARDSAVYSVTVKSLQRPPAPPLIP